ncbi:hypothetical protein SLEP1_g6744 [Rubroshorea leprosula]|uniref:Cytochrome P450 n=1 Tax=Rubroshorea leprosula TaxID=152421 RepID=A0AAV5I0S1_9ROSI|nr:hypothetical protein SLEP1_g6744 [Rubroshorea leprosula]
MLDYLEITLQRHLQSLLLRPHFACNTKLIFGSIVVKALQPFLHTRPTVQGKMQHP